MTFRPSPDDRWPPTATPSRDHSPAPAVAPWLHGRCQAGQLALAAGLGSDRLPAAVADLHLFGQVHAAVLGFVVMTAAILANSVYMQGTTGQRLGKRIVGTRLVSAIETGPGPSGSSTPAPAAASAASWPISSTCSSSTSAISGRCGSGAQDLGRLDRQHRCPRPQRRRSGGRAPRPRRPHDGGHLGSAPCGR